MPTLRSKFINKIVFLYISENVLVIKIPLCVKVTSIKVEFTIYSYALI